MKMCHLQIKIKLSRDGDGRMNEDIEKLCIDDNYSVENTY